MKLPRAILPVTISAALFWLLNFSHQVGGAKLPPAGPFLNPFSGFWQNRGADYGSGMPVLLDRVTVCFDRNRVPHIFAGNLQDLAYMQGFITARDRLWQMEFQTHAAAGRLSEIVGPRALELDRYMRRIGMVYAAENSVRVMKDDPEVMELVEAYAAGVNAWIDGLDNRSLPLEYKILDYRPERWTPLKTALLLKQMTWNLSGYSRERIMSLTMQALGVDRMKQLFPEYPAVMEPMVPVEDMAPFEPVAIPEPVMKQVEIDRFELPEEQPVAGGSNTWAVSGKMTESGWPILCSDPHLPLSLPSVWYELHLSAPGLDVYGVSLPGAPGIVIGFNRDIAWGITNSESDALDWYKVTFRDDNRTEYLYAGTWRKVDFRTERYIVRDSGVVEEQVPYTHHGPVPYSAAEKPFRRSAVPGAALRWTGHIGSNELRAFLDIDRASDHAEFVEALSHFMAPAQNFSFAARNGDIAIRQAGRLPLRWRGQGRYVSDGSDPAYEWSGWVPREHLPHTLNPDRGYVGSANQNPAGPQYPYYLGSEYASTYRASRIYELLSGSQAVTTVQMIAMQNDSISNYAGQLLPALLDRVNRRSLSEEEVRALELLEDWDMSYEGADIAPSIFDNWQEKLAELIWAEEFPDAGDNLRRPRKDVTAGLVVRQSVEERIITQALVDAVARLNESYGPMGPAWEWRNVRGTDIRHLARIPQLGRLDLPTSGQSGVIRVATRTAGQSWRMVVELGPEVRAWGNYPGGQSGDPGSRHYDDFVDDWVEGRVRPLLFPLSPDDSDFEAVSRTVFGGS